MRTLKIENRSSQRLGYVAHERAAKVSILLVESGDVVHARNVNIRIVEDDDRGLRTGRESKSAAGG